MAGVGGQLLRVAEIDERPDPDVHLCPNVAACRVDADHGERDRSTRWIYSSFVLRISRCFLVFVVFQSGGTISFLVTSVKVTDAPRLSASE